MSEAWHYTTVSDCETGGHWFCVHRTATAPDIVADYIHREEDAQLIVKAPDLADELEAEKQVRANAEQVALDEVHLRQEAEAALRGLLDILEGESGAGANYWEDDPRYERARRLVSNFPMERPDPGVN